LQWFDVTNFIFFESERIQISQGFQRFDIADLIVAES